MLLKTIGLTQDLDGIPEHDPTNNLEPILQRLAKQRPKTRG